MVPRPVGWQAATLPPGNCSINKLNKSHIWSVFIQNKYKLDVNCFFFFLPVQSEIFFTVVPQIKHYRSNLDVTATDEKPNRNWKPHAQRSMSGRKIRRNRLSVASAGSQVCEDPFSICIITAEQSTEKNMPSHFYTRTNFSFKTLPSLCKFIYYLFNITRPIL